MIKFVYFDLGGVVILDFSKTEKYNDLKKELGISPDKFDEFDAFWDVVEKELNTGRETDLLAPVIEKKFSTRVPPNYSILKNGFVDRFEVNKSIWPVINEIHKAVKVGLLTNMYPRMFSEITRRGILPVTKWDIIVDSSKVKLLKPEPGIYQLAEDKCGYKGAEILFVENSLKNVEGAKAFGWQTFLFDPSNPGSESKRLIDFFRKNA